MFASEKSSVNSFLIDINYGQRRDFHIMLHDTVTTTEMFVFLIAKTTAKYSQLIKPLHSHCFAYWERSKVLQ